MMKKILKRGDAGIDDKKAIMKKSIQNNFTCREKLSSSENNEVI